MKTFRYKLKPTKNQDAIFNKWLNTCRCVYNLALEQRKLYYDSYQLSITKYEMNAQLPELRKEFPWVKEVNAQTLQNVIDRVYRSYDRFFNGGGYPKWAKYGKYKSFSFVQNISICKKTGKLKLPKIGYVSYYNSQPLNGKIKLATIVKEQDGWYVSILCDTIIEKLPKILTTVGIDLGIKSLATLSDGTIIENPKYLSKYEVKLRSAHRAVSRKNKGSANRKKAIQKLAKAYKKVRECRKDFQHKISTKLIRENQTIVVENLKVCNMVKNHKLAKIISDAGWSQLIGMLEYKANWYGRELVKVNPAYTSQDCNVCEYRNTTLTLAVREWECPICKTIHDRDVNAAINIKNKGGRADRASLGVIQPQ